MHLFRCTQCQTSVFFDNDFCGACGATLGFVPALRRMQSYAVADNADPLTLWSPLGDGTAAAPLRPCGNRLVHGACNWMLDEGDSESLCRSCRLTRVLPALNQGRNRERWLVIERAKRRLVFGLLAMGLAPQPKNGPNDALGLDFHLLESEPSLPRGASWHRH